MLAAVGRYVSGGLRFASSLVEFTALVSFAVVVAGCGGSSGGKHVARLSSTVAQTSSSAKASPTPAQNGALAYSRCMRVHGVPNFPDPNSSGVWPKSEVTLAANNPRFQTATTACGHLLPDGGPGVPPSPAVVQQIDSDMLRFARCMRARGISNWPGPTLDQGREIFDPQAAGLNTNSPQMRTKIHQCERVFPASIGIPPGA